MKNINSKQPLADHDIEQFIGLQLRFGVVLSSLIVLTGGILYLVQSGGMALPHYQQFIGEKAGFTTGREIWYGAIGMQAKGIIQLGVVVLIATPILRIFFSLIGFIVEKDRLYILITLVVLSVMMFSIFGGLKV
ncbi:DUF1634 domain-containing protein [Mucilaginibacter polytrichastri]|uniref:DUF1634 domain-containing protein n=1 Tax=Mucilaginibacter polytrichastri TaxID=1302689 RepID=A0A1Q5ZUE9_9SPHI|nr:DUF1634 domain-containing protein [Mucilaginibacter polytrichastri]OKS85399.1 hypothetical protein RG47T_0845 [Mucilaginibacter polytrichastri]SFS39529.1 Uncharacterized membrane protein [Mucilaginibacter polytrichastri]